MNKYLVQIAIFSLFACFLSAGLADVRAEERTALVIGNSNYDTAPLANPVNDATDVANSLRKLGFTVILKKNASLEMMEEAIEEFGGRLKKGGVGLFFYAGHGMQVQGANYLIPVGARIKKESDMKYRALDAGRVLDEMANAGNGLNIVILDACRDNPFSRSFRSASRGLTIISAAPQGTFITYSTSPGNVAADGKGRNSPYTESLLRHMAEPDLPIEHVFKKVRQDLTKKTSGRQTPWELSSLSGDFFFNSSNSSSSRVTKKQIQTAAPAKAYPEDELAEERRRIAEEKEKLRRDKELLEEKNSLAETKRRIEEERRKLEEERQTLSYAPKVDPAKGTRYIDFIKAKVTNVKFFEGGYDTPSRDTRAYRTSFSRTQTRFANWELNLEHAAQGVRKDFVIEHIWFNPYGSEVARFNFNTYVKEDWVTSYHSSGYGWRTTSSNNWSVGNWRVDLYVNGTKVASENFSIY